MPSHLRHFWHSLWTDDGGMGQIRYLWWQVWSRLLRRRSAVQIKAVTPRSLYSSDLELWHKGLIRTRLVTREELAKEYGNA